jgi:hypothetical protein
LKVVRGVLDEEERLLDRLEQSRTFGGAAGTAENPM